MSDKKISELPPLTSPTLQDLLAIVNSSLTKKITLDDLFKSIGGGIVSVTKSELLALRNAFNLAPGKFYLVTDADPDGFFQVIIMAATINELCLQGCIIVKVPDYQQENGSNLGIWTPSLTPAANNKVIWGGKMWVNMTGNVGTAVDDFNLDSVNWQFSPPNVGEVYATEVDAIHYDATPANVTQWNVVKREDKRGNSVKGIITGGGAAPQNPITFFQWGRDSVTGNEVSFAILNNINALVVQKNMIVSEFANIRIPDNVTASGARIRNSQITVQGDTLLIDSEIKNSTVDTQGNYNFSGTKMDDSVVELFNQGQFTVNYQKMVIVSSTVQNQDAGNSTYERMSISDSSMQILTSGGVDFSLTVIETSDVQMLHDGVLSFFTNMCIRTSEFAAQVFSGASSFTADSAEITGSSISISSFVGASGADFSHMRIRNSDFQMQQNGAFNFSQTLIEDSDVQISDATIALPAPVAGSSNFSNFTALKNSSVSIISNGDLFVGFKASKSDFTFQTIGGADFTNASFDGSDASFIGKPKCMDMIVDQQSNLQITGNADFSQSRLSSNSQIFCNGNGNFVGLIVTQDSQLSVTGAPSLRDTVISTFANVNINGDGIFENMVISDYSQFFSSGDASLRGTRITEDSSIFVNGNGQMEHTEVSKNSTAFLGGSGNLSEALITQSSIVALNSNGHCVGLTVSAQSTVVANGFPILPHAMVSQNCSVSISGDASCSRLRVLAQSNLSISGNANLTNAEIAQGCQVVLTSNGFFNNLKVFGLSQLDVDGDANLSETKIFGKSEVNVSGAPSIQHTLVGGASSFDVSDNGTYDCMFIFCSNVASEGNVNATGSKIEQSSVDISGDTLLEIQNANISAGASVALQGDGIYTNIKVFGGATLDSSGAPNLKDASFSQNSPVSILGNVIATQFTVIGNSEASMAATGGASIDVKFSGICASSNWQLNANGPSCGITLSPQWTVNSTIVANCSS